MNWISGLRRAFISALNAGFTVDLETHEVLDVETGYPIPHIITEVSNPSSRNGESAC